MTDFDNTNRGVLFQNDKEGNDARPDYKGKLNVNGLDYELAGWKKLSKAGNPFLSLSVQEPKEFPKQDKVELNTDDPINLDDIPF